MWEFNPDTAKWMLETFGKNKEPLVQLFPTGQERGDFIWVPVDQPKFWDKNSAHNLEEVYNRVHCMMLETNWQLNFMYNPLRELFNDPENTLVVPVKLEKGIYEIYFRVERLREIAGLVTKSAHIHPPANPPAPSTPGISEAGNQQLKQTQSERDGVQQGGERTNLTGQKAGAWTHIPSQPASNAASRRTLPSHSDGHFR